MDIRTKTTTALLLAAALTACAPEGGDASTDAVAGEQGDTTQDAPSSTLVLSETGWLTVGSDGAVQTTFFDANGRYRDLRNGQLVAGGQWELRPPRTVCFEPDSGVGACWETGALDADGSATVTNGDGKAIEIKRVTYIAAPAEDADESAGG